MSFKMLIAIQNVYPWMRLIFGQFFIDILSFVKAEVNSSTTYSYNQKRHQNSKIKYFDAAFSNVPNDENISVNQSYNSKKENSDAAKCNEPNVSISLQMHIKIEQ